MTAAVIRVGGQNMTSGPVTDALRSCDLVMLQETDQPSVRRGFGSDWRFIWQPSEVPKGRRVALGWRRSRFTATGPGEWHRFHGTGKGDPRIPDGIHTPARGLLKQPLTEHRTSLDIDGYCTWLLNSWDPLRPDAWTRTRRQIVTTLELPVVRRQFWLTRRAGRIGLAEADWNSIRNPLRIRGWEQEPNRGLDRHMRTGPVTLLHTEQTPKTGRGPTMQHHGIIAVYRLETP